MPLLNRIDDLVRAAQREDAELCLQLGIKKARLDDLRAGAYRNVDVDELRALMELGDSLDPKIHPFQIVKNPAWELFDGKDVLIIRGEREGHVPRLDRKACDFLQDMVEHHGGRPIAKPEVSSDDVCELMQKSSCFFVGSPAVNRSTEVALAALYGAKPFNGSRTNRRKFPIQFEGKPLHGDTQDSALNSPSDAPALSVRRPGIDPQWARFAVTHFPDPYEKAQGISLEPAVVLVCRKPFGTGRRVASVIVAGWHGEATKAACEELKSDKMALGEDDLPPGHVALRVFAAVATKKEGGTSRTFTKSRWWLQSPWRRAARRTREEFTRRQKMAAKKTVAKGRGRK